MRARFALLAVCITLTACSETCEEREHSRFSPERQTQIFLIENPLPEHVDRVVGKGRMPVLRDRLTFRAAVFDVNGREIGAGDLIVEPQRHSGGSRINRNQVHEFDMLIYSVAAGMREGGERETTLVFSKTKPDICIPEGRERCKLPFARGVIVVPGRPYRMQLTLVKVCSPLYCERWEFKIPPGGEHSVVERRCD